jgi:NAD(P)-dependent dehydrogenase (short-subunit alcohol dehydrogenase family)
MLKGKVAIITGAAQGVGTAFATRLAAEGCKIVITDQQEKIRTVGESLSASYHVGNVADAEHVKSVVNEAVSSFGTVDILINNAGEVLRSGPHDSWEKSLSDYDQIFDSNIRGAFLFGRAVAPFMIKQNYGEIVNISTDHVKPAPGSLRHHGHGNMDLYNASKWALNGLTFDWAKALAEHNVRVNNLCIGATDTEMIRSWSGPDPDPQWVNSWMQPEETAEVLVQLLLEGSQGRTGNNIGLYAGHPCVLPDPEV